MAYLSNIESVAYSAMICSTAAMTEVLLEFDRLPNCLVMYIIGIPIKTCVMNVCIRERGPAVRCLKEKRKIDRTWGNDCFARF